MTTARTARADAPSIIGTGAGLAAGGHPAQRIGPHTSGAW